MLIVTIYISLRHRISDAAVMTVCIAAGWMTLAQCVLTPCAMAQTSPDSVSVAQAASQPGVAPANTPHLTTNVVVHADVDSGYLPDAVAVGNIAGAPLLDTPLSAAIVTRDLLNDQLSRTLADVVKNDASVGEDYAPVGYYGDFQIRGIPIDLATGLQINGMTIAGEQDVPLENKQRIEILKGIPGIESGVASAGGLINFVTKRPVRIRAIDTETDDRGSAYGALDLGHIIGVRRQFGARTNLVGESIKSYVNGANGWRLAGTGAADWRLNAKTLVTADVEYQHKVERSVGGYQLLGGVALPELDQISPSTLLGLQPWSNPNTFDTFNTGATLHYELSADWRIMAAASFSRSLIDDNVVYAYGPALTFSYDPASQTTSSQSNCTGAPNAPVYFFCPDGTYGIWDYRDPGELRIDAQARATAVGHMRTGPVVHDIAVGGEIFRRSVQQPSAAVYAYVGSENIYSPVMPVPIEVPQQTAGPQVLYEDDHQTALLVQDRIHLPGHVQLLVGGRLVSLRDHNFSASLFTDKLLWIPQYAAIVNPIARLSLYGSYSQMLSLGPQAPFWTNNGSQFLAPFTTRQVEVGAKFTPGDKLLLTIALFHLRTPFFYPKQIATADQFCASNISAGDLCYESAGHETHDGVEVNATGQAARWLRITASAAAIDAKSTDTGTPQFDNKQVLNVPHLRTTSFADIAVPHARGLHLLLGWSYTGRKQARRDDVISVASYNIFNLGAHYTPGGDNGRLSFRIYADNITDKRYWKDTGASYGDTFLHLGAPTTVRLAVHYTF